MLKPKPVSVKMGSNADETALAAENEKLRRQLDECDKLLHVRTKMFSIHLRRIELEREIADIERTIRADPALGEAVMQTDTQESKTLLDAFMETRNAICRIPSVPADAVLAEKRARPPSTCEADRCRRVQSPKCKLRCCAACCISLQHAECQVRSTVAGKAPRNHDKK